MKFPKLSNKFLFLCILYAVTLLIGLFILCLSWLPPGYALVGHDSGLPLDSKQFLQSRLFAWDDRLGFGVDNSANFGSLTIHFIDLLSSLIAGVPYAGNFISLFFWLGLIFVSGLIFAYQLKSTFGKPFVFILPILLTFNFYIFQSVFMLERAKFGIFSATLISLAVFFRMRERKLPALTAAIISALAFSIFNGGGWFGITLYGGVAIILIALILHDPSLFKRTCIFLTLTVIFYILLNAYSIISYLQNFLINDFPSLVQETLSEGHKDWLRYVSRSTSLLNLFTLFAVPDWYGEINDLEKANLSHAYAADYLNNKILVVLSFIFPALSFAGFLLAKTRNQKRVIGLFGLITLIGLIFAAGSNSPFGFFYEFLMDKIPGFIIFRSAFYKFGIFYMFGMMVMFSFTLSYLIDKLINKLRERGYRFTNLVGIFVVISVIGLWLCYHYVLLDPQKIFAWKKEQSTKVKIPEYIFNFAKWSEKEKLQESRILLLPPVNSDWQNDAYSWGYWSLSPLPYALSSARILSNWHGLNSEELGLVDDLYNAVRENNESEFFRLAKRLNVGYLLTRDDVLVGSTWSAAESLSGYKGGVESFSGITEIEKFGEWGLYKIESVKPNSIFAVSTVNIAPDNLVPLVNKFFRDDHSVGSSSLKIYKEINNVSLNKVEAFDCLSCLLERKDRLKSLPDVNILPNSLLFSFKEKQEEGVLIESKDPKVRIGDYLGLILRRTAELKKMLDLSVKEDYELKNLKFIRIYLGKLYSNIEEDKSNAYDFVMLKQTLDFLNPVEREISDYLKANLSTLHSHRFGEEMLGVLWDINKVKEYFSPILENIERWSEEKVYKVKFSEPGEYTLLIYLQALPQDLDGAVIIPKFSRFSKDSQEKMLKVNLEGDWLSLDVGFQTEGVGDLTLTFEKLPNLFNPEGSGLEKFSFGKVSCLKGSIKDFDKNRAYKIYISKTDRFQYVQVIFKDRSKVYSESHGFLKGEDLFEVPTVFKGQFSKYIYYPSTSAKDINLYICSDNQIMPILDDIYVQEFFSPSVISVKRPAREVPRIAVTIEYTRTNPVSYEIKAKKNIEEQYILVFNEKYNSSWRLTKEDEKGNQKVLSKHFMVDGYANGWLVDSDSIGVDNKFKIEYISQSSFYLGAYISTVTFLASIGWLTYKSIRRKR